MRTQTVFKTLALGLLISASSMANANPRAISLSQLELKNVSQSPDRAVSVFYAVGTPAKVATKGALPFIRVIKGAPLRADIRSDGSASIPASTVPLKGFQIFNYLVFIIHPANQNDVRICNVDGSSPTTGELQTDRCDSDYVNSIVTIYKPVQLNSSQTEVTQIGSVQTDSGNQAVIDLRGRR